MWWVRRTSPPPFPQKTLSYTTNTLPRARAEEPVVHDEDAVPASQERVGEGFESRVAWPDDGKDLRMGRVPHVSKEGEDLGVGFHPRVSVVGARGFREPRLHAWMDGHGARDEEEGWAQSEPRVTMGGSLLQADPTHADTGLAQSRIPASDTLNTAPASGRFGESMRRAIRFPPFDFRR